MSEISLYIHVPFCKQKCKYCDFPSFVGKEYLREKYIEALKKDILNRASGYKIKTIFIGGGTPSYLTEIELDSILKTINKLNLKENLEFTVECNPGTLNIEKLKIMKNNKVNRLSIGLQSCDNNILKELGRIHSFEVFKENFILARKVGFKNINVDLMFGLPNQSLEKWRDTLEKICDLNVEHVSAYSLIIEEGTVFYKLYDKDLLKLPSEDDEREMYRLAVKVFEENGYNQYEISNFSKDNKECKHNLTYWNLEEYIGCGSSASSYVDSKRLKNIENIEQYIENINLQGTAYEEIITNKESNNIEEFMFMGLRKIKGISKKEFCEKFNKSIYDLYKDIIKKHCEEKLLIDSEEKLYLTSKGIEVSNYVMSDFILD